MNITAEDLQETRERTAERGISRDENKQELALKRPTTASSTVITARFNSISWQYVLHFVLSGNPINSK